MALGQPGYPTDQVVCSNCAGSNPAGASFCAHCGQPIQAQRRFCSNCGTEMRADAQFCPACGTAAPQAQAPGGPPPQQAPWPEDTYVPVRLTIENELAEPATPGQLITNRLILFVKWLFAIPLYFFGVFYAIAAFVTIFLAFWVILVTGRFPQGLFAFVMGYVQFEYRLLAYFPLLLTNHWTPDERHPLRIEIDYPASCSRMMLLFVKLPSFLLGLVSNLIGISLLVMVLLAVPAWWAILVTGRYPAQWFALTPRLLEWNCRVTVWQNLMRDDLSLFGTTTTVKVLVIIGLAFSLLVGGGNCTASL